MANFINIIANACILDATGSPIVNGILTVTPSSKFRVGGGGQALGEAIRRIITNGSLTEPLQLADPSLTSPQDIGYTFEVVDSSTHAVETYDNVLIVPDENGDWNFATLNTGNFVEGVPTATPDGGITSITVTTPLTNTSGTIAISKATASADGYLAAADFATFEAKASALGYTPLNPSNNLSDVDSASTARTNLGLGSAATTAASAYDPAGTAASTAAAAIVPLLAKANNLSDVASATTARTNLGLGTIATQASTAVAVTGGTIDGTTIGATTPAPVWASKVFLGSGGDAVLMTEHTNNGRSMLQLFAGVGLSWGASYINFFPAGLSIGTTGANPPANGLCVGTSGQLQVSGTGQLSILSPNGTRYAIAVDNNGNLSATAL